MTKRLLMLFVSITVSLIFCEILIRIVAPQNLIGQRFEQTEKGLAVNRSRGSSIEQNGNHVARYAYYYPHLRDTPLKEGIRILMVGDSFTFGVLLNKTDTIAHHLQQYADEEFGKEKFCFLNAGTGGWGTADYVAFVDDFGEEIKPGIILVLLNTDDIGRSVKSRLFSFASETGLGVKRNVLRRNYFKGIINSIPGYQWLIEHSHLAQLLKAAALLVYEENRAPIRPVDITKGPSSDELNVPSSYSSKLGQALFTHLKETCSRRATELYIVTTGWQSVKKSENYREPTRVFMSQAQEFFKSLDVPFCDISPQIIKIKKETGKQYSFPEGHPNEEGSRLIAENIWQYFLKERLADYLYSHRK